MSRRIIVACIMMLLDNRRSSGWLHGSNMNLYRDEGTWAEQWIADAKNWSSDSSVEPMFTRSPVRLTHQVEACPSERNNPVVQILSSRFYSPLARLESSSCYTPFDMVLYAVALSVSPTSGIFCLSLILVKATIRWTLSSLPDYLHRFMGVVFKRRRG